MPASPEKRRDWNNLFDLYASKKATGEFTNLLDFAAAHKLPYAYTSQKFQEIRIHESKGKMSKILSRSLDIVEGKLDNGKWESIETEFQSALGAAKFTADRLGLAPQAEKQNVNVQVNVPVVLFSIEDSDKAKQMLGGEIVQSNPEN